MSNKKIIHNSIKVKVFQINEEYLINIFMPDFSYSNSLKIKDINYEIEKLTKLLSVCTECFIDDVNILLDDLYITSMTYSNNLVHIKLNDSKRYDVKFSSVSFTNSFFKQDEVRKLLLNNIEVIGFA